MLSKLDADDVYSALDIKNMFAFSPEVLASTEIQNLAMGRMLACLDHDDIKTALKIRDEFALPSETLTSDLVQDAAKRAVLAALRDDYINKAVEIKNGFALPAEVIASDEIQSTARYIMRDKLLDDDIGEAVIIKDNFAVPTGVSEAVAKEMILAKLNRGHLKIAMEIKNKFAMPAEGLASDEIRTAAKANMADSIRENDLDVALMIKDAFALPEEAVWAIAKEEMVASLGGDWKVVSIALKIKDKFALPAEILNSAEVQGAAKVGMLSCINDGDDIYTALLIKDAFGLPEKTVRAIAKEALTHGLSIGNYHVALDIKNKFALPAEILNSAEVQDAAKAGMLSRINDGDINSAFMFKNEFALPSEMMTSSEVRAAGKAGVIKNLKNYKNKNKICAALNIKKYLGLPAEIIDSPEVQVAAQEAVIALTRAGDISDAMRVIEEFQLPAEIINSPETVAAAKNAMISHINFGYVDDALKVKNLFALPKEILNSVEVRVAAERWMAQHLYNDDQIKRALKFKDEFLLPAEVVLDAAKKAMTDRLKNNDMTAALRIKNEFELTEEVVVAAAKEGLLASLGANNLEAAFAIKEALLPQITPKEFFDLCSPHLEEILSVLGKSAPHLIPQLERSADLCIRLFQFKNKPEVLEKTIKEAPFLTSALAENPRYAGKLLAKYPSFDRISQEKITFLYNTKEKILTAQPELDPQCLEFRQAMQKELRGFEQNEHIVAKIEQAGVNMEAFLSYGPSHEFILQTGEETIPLSERIQTPIARIGETLGTYAHKVKQTMAEYQRELLAAKVKPKSAEELEASIKDTEEKLKDAVARGNERQIKGMTKGLEGMRSRLAQMTEISLWERIIKEIDGFQILKTSLVGEQNELLTIENHYLELLTGKGDRKDLPKMKANLARAKEEFKNLLAHLERRVTEFRTHLIQRLSILGQDRATALVQEIDQQMTEQFNHLDNDRATLANLFTDRADTARDRLRDAPMSISVWARNPDIDLYQGNYSPCCIRIDSEHMGSKCTIADYATDLGVQVVNVRDSSRNEPVVAAWCWIGKNKEGGTALVVDNIEANTLYSTNFPEKIWGELQEYLITYGKACKVDRIVLGKANDDLPVATELNKLPEAKMTYEKLGGANTRLDGYFLEAKGASVKLLYERSARIAKEEKEKSRRA